MIKPFDYKKPDSFYTQSIRTPYGSTSTQVTFHGSDIRLEEMAATDPLAYAQALYESADNPLNSPEWRAMMNEVFPSEVRPYGAQPTAPQVALMENRSVTFDPRQTYDGQVATQGSAVAGSLISMEAPEVGILVSARVSILDHTMQFGFTQNGMIQTGEKLMSDLELTMAGKIAESLEGQPSVSKVYAGPLSAGTPASQAEVSWTSLPFTSTPSGAVMSPSSALWSLCPSVRSSTERPKRRASRTSMSWWGPMFRSTTAQTGASSWCPSSSPCCPSVKTRMGMSGG